MAAMDKIHAAHGSPLGLGRRGPAGAFSRHFLVKVLGFLVDHFSQIAAVERVLLPQFVLEAAARGGIRGVFLGHVLQLDSVGFDLGVGVLLARGNG